MKKEIEKYLLKTGSTIKTAMKQLDVTHKKILFLIDDSEILIGSLTDGDIRRWILAEGDLNDDVKKAVNLNPFSLGEKYSLEKLKSTVIKEKFSAVPIIDKNGKLKDIIFEEDLLKEQTKEPNYRKIDIPVVIMAGGMGTRLEPFTKILPKPLIPVGDKTIIERIIDKFINYSVKHFFISVNHKSGIIKLFFEELCPNYQIEFIEETKPLGTIGALSYLRGKTSKPILITNCDIIIETDYADVLDFHLNNNYDISLVASMTHHKIPYGICEISTGGELKKFIEKPEYSFLVSTGMYIVNSNLLELIPQNTFYHITNLIEKVRSGGGKVGVYPISENSWLDTGEWHEYKKTIENFKL